MVSIVQSTTTIKNQGKIWVITKDFSTTIAAGARSTPSPIDITSIGPFNKVYIVGIAIVSENNTDWRIKFYKKDSGIGATTYDQDTYIGDVEVTSLSATADTFYEGSVECLIPYWDQDGTYEFHVIAENIGQTNTSKMLLNIMYSQAD